MVSNIAEKSYSLSISLFFSNFNQIYSLVVQAATDLSSLAKYGMLVYYIRVFISALIGIFVAQIYCLTNRAEKTHFGLNLFINGRSCHSFCIS